MSDIFIQICVNLRDRIFLQICRTELSLSGPHRSQEYMEMRSFPRTIALSPIKLIHLEEYLWPKWALRIRVGIYQEFRILLIRNACSFYEFPVKFLSNSLQIRQCPLRGQGVRVISSVPHERKLHGRLTHHSILRERICSLQFEIDRGGIELRVHQSLLSPHVRLVPGYLREKSLI
jgi:hypothetical protein